MNKADPGTPRRTILSVSGLVVLSLIFLCGVDQVKAQSQSTTESHNIDNKDSLCVGVGTTMPSSCWARSGAATFTTWATNPTATNS